MELNYEYTLRNHFRFGYEPALWFETRQDSRQKFTADYGAIRSAPRSWRQANLQAAIEIYERLPKPHWVLFSGGTDSEICLRSFAEAGIPTRAATLRLKRGYNDHDLNYVKKYAAETRLQLEVFELDIEEFFSGDQLDTIVNPISCVSPILAAHLWLADQLDGTPIIAQGEPHLKKDIPEGYIPGVSPYEPSNWRLYESERLCSLYLHFILKNRPAVPGFFQYTPEQFYTYLTNNPILRQLVDNQILGKLGTRTSKNAMARRFYPEVEERPKFTGFEALNELHDQKRAELARRFPANDSNWSIEYRELIQLLEGTVR